MRGLVVPLLISCMLLVSAGAALGEGDHGKGGARGGEAPAARSERGSGEDRGPAPLGAFAVATGAQTVTGEHLSFNYSETGIAGFRAENVTLFDLAIVGGHAGEGGGDRSPRVQTDGAMLRVREANYSFTAHDNPSAVGKLETAGAVTFTFAPNTVLSAGDDGSTRFSLGGVTGSVRGEGFHIVGQTLVGRGEALVFLDRSHGSFDSHRGEIGHGIELGHVGAEATFNSEDGQHVQQDVVSYGNVTMTTIKAEHGNLTLQIEGHGTDGRVLVFNVDGRVIGAESADKLNITIDNTTVAPASNFSDIMNPDDDGFQPEYYVVYDPGAHAFQLVVTLPHYSVHTMSVTLVEILKPSVVIGIVAGVALLVPTALVLFRRH